MLYQYAVLYREDEDEEQELLVKPTNIIANDEAAVRFIAAQLLAKKYNDPSCLEILVRPFA